MKKKRTIDDFRKSCDYLPDFLKDFHDQKDFFKVLYAQYENEFEKDLPQYTWRDNHIFTIDFLLWFLAAHGYTLQKSRAKVQFADISATIEYFKAKSRENFANILNP